MVERPILHATPDDAERSAWAFIDAHDLDQLERCEPHGVVHRNLAATFRAIKVATWNAAIEACAEKLEIAEEALTRAENVLADMGDSEGPTRDGQTMSLRLAETWAANALPMIRAALDAIKKTENPDDRFPEAPAGTIPSRPAEAPTEPGTSSPATPSVWARCGFHTLAPGMRHVEDADGRCYLEPDKSPATPDDAERVAQDFYAGKHGARNPVRLAKLLRALLVATHNAAIEAAALRIPGRSRQKMRQRIRALKREGRVGDGRR